MTVALAGRASVRPARGVSRAPARRHPASLIAPARRHPASRIAPARRATASWEIRSFAAVLAFIVGLFVVAVLYLGQTTAVSAGGYEVQRLTDARDELRRQNALLEVRIARLDSPTRVETEATKLGLVRARTVPIISAETLAALH